MKHLTQFITEYIVKKKLDKAIDSEDHYEYFPKSKRELIDIIKTLLDKGETNLNRIHTNNKKKKKKLKRKKKKKKKNKKKKKKKKKTHKKTHLLCDLAKLRTQ